MIRLTALSRFHNFTAVVQVAEKNNDVDYMACIKETAMYSSLEPNSRTDVQPESTSNHLTSTVSEGDWRLSTHAEVVPELPRRALIRPILGF